MMTGNRDFIKEFKNRMAQIDETPTARYDNYVAPKKVVLSFYNIVKRAVPYKNNPINKVIAINLLLEDALRMQKRLVLAEKERRGVFMESSDNVFFMYEIVPAEATVIEQSPFYNEGSPVL